MTPTTLAMAAIRKYLQDEKDGVPHRFPDHPKCFVDGPEAEAKLKELLRRFPPTTEEFRNEY